MELIKKYDYHGKQSIEYYNFSSSFDIETTSTYSEAGDKVAFMYAWALMIRDESNYFTGRTWEEFLQILDQLKDELQLSYNRRLVIYVHNLGYEFQFMRKYFNWDYVFSIDERKPIKAITTDGLEFRDSLILSGYSLAKTAENLNSHRIEKLVGDLDYKKIRTSNTPLTAKEWDYIKKDVQIIIYYIDEQLEIYGDITKIPMTNTGRVREYVKHNCYYTQGKSKYRSSKGKYNNYRNVMKGLTINDSEEYCRLKWAFMGGFTHSNPMQTDEIIEDVHSIDFTSSYPAVMITEQFPMGTGFEVSREEIREKGLEYYTDKFCCLITIGLRNLKNKFVYDSYLSESKCKIKGNREIVNGRVYSADIVTTIITEQDLYIIDKVYSYDYYIEDMICYPKGYLPKQIIKSILELYQKKTELKGVEGKEVEYLLSKGMLNSIYGMTVTDIVKDNIIYDGDSETWELEEVDTDEEITSYNNKRSRFLYYPWGVWVTAYARKNLWLGILNFKEDYIYADTDSIKFLNYEKHLDFIETYNRLVEEKEKAVLNYYNIDHKYLYPKTINGEIKVAGVWDYEGHYSRFKTLGSKRYLVEEDGKLYLTVAGLSKTNGIEYMKRVCNYDNTKVFEMFTDDLTIPPEETGKNTHTYVDAEHVTTVTDYMGNVDTVKTLSGIHLEETGFTLSVSDRLLKFLDDLKAGYIYKGTF